MTTVGVLLLIAIAAAPEVISMLRELGLIGKEAEHG